MYLNHWSTDKSAKECHFHSIVHLPGLGAKKKLVIEAQCALIIIITIIINVVRARQTRIVWECLCTVSATVLS